MQYKSVLGVDISKRKFDVCLMINGKSMHKIFDNNQEGYQKLEAWCLTHEAGHMHICMEATSYYGEGLAQFAYQKGHTVSVVNPAQTKAFTKSELLRGKTDKSDAAAIARFCIAHNPVSWQPQPKELRDLRDMHRCLKSLKEQKQHIANKLENENIYSVVRKSWLALLKEFDKQIEKLEQEMKKHIKSDPHLKEKVENLTSIKGVGETTAYAIISEMPAVEGFQNARQYAAFAGLNPVQKQSGSSIKTRGRICKMGSGGIRKALYMPAMVVKTHNPHFKEFCNRLEKKGKSPKVIIVAIMRKLLHICFGVLKHNQKFNPELV